jgi:hypothetical protein
MGTEKRAEPGTENKIKLNCPDPTSYEIPSKVQFSKNNSIYR